MNSLKQYALERMQEFRMNRPALYDDSIFSTIKDTKDVEKQLVRAENIISGSEKEQYASRIPANEERDLAVYNAYKAVEKAANCMSPVAIIQSRFDEITKEEFDCWCDKLHNLIKRCYEQDSRYASRPDN